MRTVCILIVVTLLMVENAGAQQRDYGLISGRIQKFVPCMDMGVGYILDKKYEVITLSATFNNIYLQRFGGFVMVEMNMVTPAIVIGPTVSISDLAYIFGGFDFLTSRGFYGRGGFEHARKDIGIGFYPVRWATVKIVHSFNAGSRMEIGFRIPLEKEPQLRFNRK